MREDLSGRILKAVQEADIDPDVVKAFMRTPAFESLAGTPPINTDSLIESCHSAAIGRRDSVHGHL